MFKNELAALSRRQLMALSHVCFQEQRPPRISDFKRRTPNRPGVRNHTDRTSTGLFDMLGDDTLAEVLKRLPLVTRVRFSVCVCKQFTRVASTFKVFEELDVSSDYKLQWDFLRLCSRDVCVKELTLREKRACRVEMPSAGHLSHLKCLKLHDVKASTLSWLRQNIPIDRLQEMEVFTRECSVQLTTILKRSNNLERLFIYSSYVSKRLPEVFHKWRLHHGGYPPLSCLQCHVFDSYLLELLDLRELHCISVSKDIECVRLPSIRKLKFYVPSCWYQGKGGVNKLISCCPNLEVVTLVDDKYRDGSKVGRATKHIQNAFPGLTLVVDNSHVDPKIPFWF